MVTKQVSKWRTTGSDIENDLVSSCFGEAADLNQAGKTPVDKYLSPRSQTMETMVACSTSLDS